ncbi:MAG: methyltransferase [Clostridia bacterium]
MGRSEDTLHSGLKLIQDDRFFKLGQDTVLLTDFAKVKSNEKICDLGCGNGAISVLLYGKNTKIHVDAVEIQSEVAELARENAILNNLPIRVFNEDAKEVDKFLKRGEYDVVISNPPYFKENSGLETESMNKKIARVEREFDVFEVCKSAKYLLKYGGRIYIVQKPERTSDIFRAMFDNGIEPKRMKYVLSTANSAPSVVLVEGKVGAKSGIIVEPALITRNDDLSYTDELKRIYKR